MPQLRDGSIVDDPRLDRLPPKDWEHYEKWPLTSPMAQALQPSPVVLGVNWYSAFDEPVKDRSGHHWVGRHGFLGRLRGGHSVCLKPRKATDPASWWDYHNQGSEGRCVQYGVSRMMSHLNRKMYEVREDDPEGRWLYWEAQKTDEWEGGSYPGASPFYEGTSVRAALNVVVKYGIIPKRVNEPVLEEGIKAYRWISSMNDLTEVLGYQGLGYVDMLNSWGRSYPHLTRVPLEVMDRLLREDGEFGVPVDR